MTVTGQKHLVKCRCVLPQFKSAKDPIRHQFIVFSLLDDDVVRQKYVQCNNCGLIHRVTELGRSEIVAGKEHMNSLVTIDDIKVSLPQQLSALLEKSNVDLPTWEQAKYIIDQQRWGDIVLLSVESEGQQSQGKYVRIMGPNLFNVDSFLRTQAIL